MLKLSDGLRDLGVESVVAAWQAFAAGARVRPGCTCSTTSPLDYALGVYRWATEANVPVVFSPLFHATYRHWFETAIHDTTRWSAVSTVIGRRATWALYRRFQDAKMPVLRGWS